MIRDGHPSRPSHPIAEALGKLVSGAIAIMMFAFLAAIVVKAFGFACDLVECV